jgi:hypothetical protein
VVAAWDQPIPIHLLFQQYIYHSLPQPPPPGIDLSYGMDIAVGNEKTILHRCGDKVRNSQVLLCCGSGRETAILQSASLMAGLRKRAFPHPKFTGERRN